LIAFKEDNVAQLRPPVIAISPPSPTVSRAIRKGEKNVDKDQ